MSNLDDIRKRTEGHVPGPWYQTDDEDYTYVFKDYKDTRYTIATAEDGWLECGSNAALIAAAPDLLRLATEQEERIAELEKRQRWIDEVGPPHHPDDERSWAGAYLDMRQRVTEREAELTQLRAERDSWKGMYMLCNEREQELLKIKELAEKFTQAYDDSHCWIENGTEEVSTHLDDLTSALTQREGGEDESA